MPQWQFAYDGPWIEYLERRRLLSATFSSLYALGDDFPNGQDALTIDAAGDLFGIASIQEGGRIFELAAGTHTPTTLATSVHSPNGPEPGVQLVIDSAGNLDAWTLTYVTLNPQSADIIQLSAADHTVKTLANLPMHGVEPATPGSLLLDPAGNLFGLTFNTCFEITADTHTVIPLATGNDFGFANTLTGSGLIRDPAGNVYGEARFAGSAKDGMIFTIPTGTHVLKTVATFDGTNGSTPSGDLVCDSAGNLYGTTEVGGASGNGTLFEISAGSHQIETLQSFAIGSGRVHPLLLTPQGNIVGATDATTGGNIFEFSPTNRHFENFKAPGSVAALISDSVGNLYGTTRNGGASDDGTVFKVAAGSDEVSTLTTFDGSNGARPSNRLLVDAQGNLYGETTFSGTATPTNVFEISGSGFVTSSPEILTQPANQATQAGRTAVFSAAAFGPILSTVRWQQSTDGGQTFSDITDNPSATTTSLTVSGLAMSQSGALYRAVFTNGVGSTTSRSAALTVLPALKLVASATATPVKVKAGSTVLTALGTDPSNQSSLTYTWSVTRSPAGAKHVTFSTNRIAAANKTTAFFHKPGRYTLTCTISDGNGRKLFTSAQVDVLSL